MWETERELQRTSIFHSIRTPTSMTRRTCSRTSTSAPVTPSSNVPWLCRIELNTQPLLVRDRPSVDHVGIRLSWYLQQLRDREGIEGRAVPTFVAGAQDEFTGL